MLQALECVDHCISNGHEYKKNKIWILMPSLNPKGNITFPNAKESFELDNFHSLIF